MIVAYGNVQFAYLIQRIIRAKLCNSSRTILEEIGEIFSWLDWKCYPSQRDAIG